MMRLPAVLITMIARDLRPRDRLALAATHPQLHGPAMEALLKWAEIRILSCRSNNLPLAVAGPRACFKTLRDYLSLLIQHGVRPLEIKFRVDLTVSESGTHALLNLPLLPNSADTQLAQFCHHVMVTLFPTAPFSQMHPMETGSTI